MKQQLLLGSSHSHTHHQSPSPSKLAVTERERFIAIDSDVWTTRAHIYMEFAANVASPGTSQELSVQFSATDSVRLLGSIDKTSGRGVASLAGGGVASTTSTAGTETEKSQQATPTEENQGFFGTLSSLWASTFGGRTN